MERTNNEYISTAFVFCLFLLVLINKLCYSILPSISLSLLLRYKYCRRRRRCDDTSTSTPTDAVAMRLIHFRRLFCNANLHVAMLPLLCYRRLCSCYRRLCSCYQDATAACAHATKMLPPPVLMLPPPVLQCYPWSMLPLPPPVLRCYPWCYATTTAAVLPPPVPPPPLLRCCHCCDPPLLLHNANCRWLGMLLLSSPQLLCYRRHRCCRCRCYCHCCKAATVDAHVDHKMMRLVLFFCYCDHCCGATTIVIKYGAAFYLLTTISLYGTTLDTLHILLLWARYES